MQKTPDKIKKGLDFCSRSTCGDKDIECPYECGNSTCLTHLTSDALALIQQLEAESTRRHEMLIQAYSTIEALSKAGKKAVENLTERCKQLEAERDAMKALFVDSYELCVICKHQVYDDSVCSKVDYCCKLCSPNCACHGCVEASHYEWRGVQKEATP